MIDRSRLESALGPDTIWRWLELPASPAVYSELVAPMPDALERRLRALGIHKLFSHQARCLELGLGSTDFLVSTSTNSGKTLAFALPSVALMLKEPAARMLYLAPTKALARDQTGRLELLVDGLGLRVGTYDGDTPKSQRAMIRREANIVVSNPDMLHAGILPNHENWTRFMRSLRVIVLDEAHVYRGVFGSHVGNVLRRLLRLCESYGRRPAIFAASGTLANQGELFRSLTGRDCAVVDSDGAHRSARLFGTVSSPPGENWSANWATAKLMVELIEQGQRVLCFSRSRIGAELVGRYARELGSHYEIETYRGGYTAKERVQIQDRFASGALLGLSATNALELGLDIGGLDAVVVNGYPGTRASFRQQAGRAGRGLREGVVLFVANADPLESLLADRPMELAIADTEPALLNPANPPILDQHLLCAAYERPIQPAEATCFGATAAEQLEALDHSGAIRYSDGRFFYPAHESPASRISIRGGSSDEVVLMHGSEVLGTMERWRAMGALHESAVYLHRGETFVVRELDLASNRAWLKPKSVEYYTAPILQSILTPRVSLAVSGPISLIGAQVASHVIGYRMVALDGGATLSEHGLELPAHTLDTLAVRFGLGTDSMLDPNWLGAVHGVEHALAATAPLFAGCARQDLGSTWYAFDPAIEEASCAFFDQQQGGVGIAEALFSVADRWLLAATEMLSSCACEHGCARCLLMPLCESANEPLWKAGSIELLQRLING